MSTHYDTDTTSNPTATKRVFSRCNPDLRERAREQTLTLVEPVDDASGAGESLGEWNLPLELRYSRQSPLSTILPPTS